MPHTIKLRRLGNSTIMPMPPAVMDCLDVQAESLVDLMIEHDRLIVTKHRPTAHYHLEDLLKGYPDQSQEDQEWLAAPAVGKENL